MEPIYAKEYEVSPVAVDPYGRLKASRILEYLQTVAGEHSILLGTDQNALMDKNLFWAVIRHRVQISRLPHSGEKLRIETWPMPTTRTAYPRSTIAYDEEGNECFRSISLWILMDSASRAMVLPGRSGVQVSGLLRGCELQAPSSMLPREMGAMEERYVRYTDLDLNGHMNNCRYLDWVDDLLPSAFHARHELKEFTLCYMSEVMENEPVQLHWELSDGPVLTVEAVRQDQTDSMSRGRVFSARLELAEVVLYTILTFFRENARRLGFPDKIPVKPGFYRDLSLLPVENAVDNVENSAHCCTVTVNFLCIYVNRKLRLVMSLFRKMEKI